MTTAAPQRKALTPVKSSNISGHGYENGVLTIEFKGGARYDYHGVHPDMFEQLKLAESPGKFISKNIIPAYKAVKQA